MKKKEVVKSKIEFNDIIKNCPFFKNKNYTIYIRKKSKEKSRFGIAISKKVGNAVIRNKLKRRLRAIIDAEKENFPKSCDYIIMIKRNCAEISFQEMKESLIQLIKEIK